MTTYGVRYQHEKFLKDIYDMLSDDDFDELYRFAVFLHARAGLSKPTKHITGKGETPIGQEET